MNKEEIQKNIGLYYSKLPPNLQEIFSSMRWLETLKQISSKYNLTEDQIRIIGTETTIVLLGMNDLTEYERILERELSLSKDLFKKIMEEIDTSVINTVRPDLIKTFEKNINIEKKEEIERKKILDERFEKLPIEIQNSIKESNYYEKLYEIGGKYGLLISEIVELEAITTNVMMGIIKGEKFEETVKNKLRLSEEKTKGLVYEITEKILKNIREKIEKIYPNESETKISSERINQILGNAGIEILPEKETLPQPEKLEIVGEVKPQPIFAEKLTMPVQSQTTRTEHTLDNISKTSIPETPTVNNEKPKIDPYREIPE